MLKTSFFSGPKSYKLLSTQFCLPTPRTLQRIVQGLKFLPGLQDHIFNILKSKVYNLNDVDKLCIMCIDKPALKANLFYNISFDEVIGFEDHGHGKSFLSALGQSN